MELWHNMNAPDVTLTDFFIALICLYFAVRLVYVQAMHHDLRKLFVGLFISTAVAAAAGGIFHGYFETSQTVWPKVLWKLTLLAIGCTAFYLWHIGFYFGLPQKSRRYTGFFLQMGILGYAFYVGYISQDFIVAIIAYLPAVLFLTGALIVRFFKAKDSRFLIAILAMVLTIAAAAIQVLKIDLHPQYFNHNAFYHVIQALGLYLLYRFSLRVVVWN
jgi:hypothetical protein